MSWRFREFLSQIKGLDEDAFLAQYPYPLLLSEGQLASGASGKGDAPTGKVGTVEQLAAYSGPDAEDAWVLPVRRKDTSKHLTIVTVGRGDECDVRISHPLVSKKHAYFTKEGDGWTLADAESTNCTFADGNKLEPHKAHRLTESVALRFGPVVKYRFFAPRAFHAYCVMRARMKTSDGARPAYREPS